MANCELDRALAPKRRHLCLATQRACGRCGKERLIAATHMPQGDASIREILSRMHHDGCGGRAGKAELLTGIEGVSSGPVRKIVLREG